MTCDGGGQDPDLSTTLAAVAHPTPDLDPQLIKAISHPLRHRLLLLLNDRVASPKELAVELDQPIGRVSHHIRTLAALGAIELVDTRPRRGAVEHFYRATIRPWFTDDAWARIPRSTRQAIFAEYLQRITSDVRAAIEHGGFDHPRAHVSYTLLELDEAAMAEVAEILSDALERIAKVSSSGANARSAEVAILLFESPA
jgi:DNA-binding transcriptional ArsR family regulator